MDVFFVGAVAGIFVVLALLLPRRFLSEPASASEVQFDSLLMKNLQLPSRVRHGGIVMIDANNVRGASAFRLSLDGMCASLCQYAASHGLRHRVIVFIDHGPAQKCFSRGGILLVFSGTRWTADDMIVRDAAWFAGQGVRHISVVTSDRLLRQRCKASARLASADCRLAYLQNSQVSEALLEYGRCPLVPSTSGQSAFLNKAHREADSSKRSKKKRKAAPSRRALRRETTEDRTSLAAELWTRLEQFGCEEDSVLPKNGAGVEDPAQVRIEEYRHCINNVWEQYSWDIAGSR